MKNKALIFSVVLAGVASVEVSASDFKVFDGKFWTSTLGVPNSIVLNQEGQSEFVEMNDLIERLSYANDSDGYHAFVHTPESSSLVFAFKPDPVLEPAIEKAQHDRAANTLLKRMIPNIPKKRTDPAIYSKDLWCRVLGFSTALPDRYATFECELRRNQYTEMITAP